MPIQFELSRDPAMLQQYYKIREFCFRNDLGLIDFDGAEDRFDRDGLVMIARDGDQCIGGARISGNLTRSGNDTKIQTQQLPLEHEGLDLGHWFPQLEQDQVAYCQWTRLALLPKYRNVDNVRNIVSALIESALQHGYQYAFNVAGMNRARLYKRMHSSLGYRYQIMEQIPVPEEEGFLGLPHLLSVTHLGEVRATLIATASAA